MKIDQIFEWRNTCIQTDTVLRNYAESMRAVTATINFQVCKMCNFYGSLVLAVSSLFNFESDVRLTR